MFLYDSKKFKIRLEELKDAFHNVDAETSKVILPLISKVAYLEDQLAYLEDLPHIRVNPNNPAQQKTTEAALLYKKRQESYMNAVRILISVLNKTDSSATDTLLELLKRFE